ncbi:hypothetical protein pEaSNUABM14_00063 [Erwinia phage pEa_SNUABM_14]|uniref:Uncharacterized protein n=1 Tax=Erwinia phage pEa_SNUABM_7 TaxID=2866695 RepID=A0AAE7WS56_9CAUD|nr:hypothetical protein MPK74_gp064 [Erwinia phage pEa_SNUABM_7]QYW04388.1 hypothetical protein pEaSNUABM14_00063 [Erwinia phage pEa_SNUABM_14]QYW04732.1 hypothetical protein pEaSNUABM7_00064 [Erwinia phage pEa_SNUABM_7]
MIGNMIVLILLGSFLFAFCSYIAYKLESSHKEKADQGIYAYRIAFNMKRYLFARLLWRISSAVYCVLFAFALCYLYFTGQL